MTEQCCAWNPIKHEWVRRVAARVVSRRLASPLGLSEMMNEHVNDRTQDCKR